MLAAIGQPDNSLGQHLAGNVHAAVIAPAAVAPEKLVGIWHPGVGQCYYVARASDRLG